MRRRAFVALAAAVCAGPALAAPGDPDDLPLARSLAGRLLVATGAIRSVPFAGGVIYLLKHNHTGAIGLIVNRPVERRSIEAVVRTMKLPPIGIDGEIDVRDGGPVGTTEGFLLHTTDYVGEGTQFITETIALTSHVSVLADIARGKGPRRAMFALGFAGWGAGQLDREIDRGFWFSVPADEEIIFDDDHATKWQRAFFLRGPTP